jgi:hypothetical protein
MFSNPLTGILEKLTVEDRIVLAIIQKAINGDLAAFQEIQTLFMERFQTN